MGSLIAEQWLVTSRAAISAGALFVVECATEGGFGAVSAQNLVLLGREQAPPLLVGKLPGTA